MVFKCVTNFPVAYDSPDCHSPVGGSVLDNSRNHKFNEKLYAYFDKRKLLILDLGCAGGGFVKDCLDDGHLAVGLDGCDANKWAKRHEWGTIPNNLFTCDIARPFSILKTSLGIVNNPPSEWEYTKFDVISIWEVIEHIPESRLSVLFNNIKRHLAPTGIVIGSISTMIGSHHQCVHEQDWWLETIRSNGLFYDQSIVDYFGDDVLRMDGGSFTIGLKHGKKETFSES